MFAGKRKITDVGGGGTNLEVERFFLWWGMLYERTKLLDGACVTVKYPTITREFLERVPRGVAQVPRERETREGVKSW